MRPERYFVVGVAVAHAGPENAGHVRPLPARVACDGGVCDEVVRRFQSDMVSADDAHPRAADAAHERIVHAAAAAVYVCGIAATVPDRTVVDEDRLRLDSDQSSAARMRHVKSAERHVREPCRVDHIVRSTHERAIDARRACARSRWKEVDDASGPVDVVLRLFVKLRKEVDGNPATAWAGRAGW